MVNREQRILQVLHNGGFSDLTFLQKSIIPLALDGESIIAETGINAGKTVSYIIPSIINLDDTDPGLKIIVIVPSVEDVKKVSEQYNLFCREGAEKVSVVAFLEENNTKGELAVLEKKPDILISTPGKIIDHIRLGSFDLSSILTCIIDCGDEQYNGFSNDIEYIHSAFSVLTRYWVFTKDREMIPIFHHLLVDIDPQIIYSDRGIKSSTAERQEEKMEFSADQESKYAEIIKKMVKNIKEEEAAEEMNQFKKLVKRNVPFTMRGYFSAYLFKLFVTNTKPAHAPSQNRADKDYKTLFFNIGRTRGLNPQALIRFITASAEIDSSEIGQIRVHDNYSFVDVAEPNVQKVLDSLTSKVYRGRTLAVNFAKKNTETPKA
ncbi:MAG: DbpA RNA binding domain-containing protein [Spirochaetia bacterium]|nr:DbpA RNA binding domain-containing protein [Spirochaetia bacterium]